MSAAREIDWTAVYETRDGASSVGGHYHDNYVVVTDDVRTLLRVPRTDEPLLDLRQLEEDEVLDALADSTIPSPRPVYASTRPKFSVLELLDGETVADRYPSGAPLPDHVVSGIVTTLCDLAAQHDRYGLEIPAGWPVDGGPSYFAEICRRLDVVMAPHRDLFEGTLNELQVPAQPFVPLLRRASRLSRRRLTLCHGDLHRGNLLANAHSINVIDWELAMISDPLYDIAIHFHRTRYAPNQESEVLHRLRVEHPCGKHAGFDADIALYRALEVAKSGVVDTIRYARRMSFPDVPQSAFSESVSALHGKLRAASEVWRSTPPSPQRVAKALAAVQRHHG